MNILESSGKMLAASANGNPVISVLVVILFYIMFSTVEASVEKLIFGERFEHWLDLFFQIAFMGYAGYSVVACAVFNSKQLQR